MTPAQRDELVKRLRRRARSVEDDDDFTSADLLREAADALASLPAASAGAADDIPFIAKRITQIADHMSTGLQTPGWRPSRSFLAEQRDEARKCAARLLAASPPAPLADVSRAGSDIECITAERDCYLAALKKIAAGMPDKSRNPAPAMKACAQNAIAAARAAGVTTPKPSDPGRPVPPHGSGPDRL